jgi:prohibitin 2
MLCRDQLRDRAKEFWLVLDDVSITDLSFGSEFTAAIEAKQVAQQNAQRAALTVEKV